MTDGTRILRTAGIPLLIAIMLLVAMPKMCARAVLVSKTRQETASRAAGGLHIESSQKPVTWPGGLDAERVRYLIESDSHFSTPSVTRLSKASPSGMPVSEQQVAAALQKLGYAETGSDGNLAMTRDGLLHIDGLTDEGTSWTFPLAKREFVSVTTVDADGANSLGTFAWRWQPTAVGSELMPTPKRHDAKAELTNSAGHWMLVQISELDDELK